MELKDKLAELRNKKGLSQIAAAEALNVSRQAISRWETGASAPSTENLIELSRLYGVSMDELVNGGESGRAENEAESAASAPPRRISRRLWLAVIALALAVLAAIIGAYLSWRGESDDKVIKVENMQENVMPNFEDIKVLPWGK